MDDPSVSFVLIRIGIAAPIAVIGILIMLWVSIVKQGFREQGIELLSLVLIYLLFLVGALLVIVECTGW